jgi:hypothetical protein
MLVKSFLRCSLEGVSEECERDSNTADVVWRHLS